MSATILEQVKEDMTGEQEVPAEPEPEEPQDPVPGEVPVE